MSISKSDVKDLDFIDAPELASTNKADYRTGDTLVSTTSSTKIVVFSAGTLLINGDLPPEPGDTIILTGTSGADGTYMVSSIVDDTSLTVVETIADSTGGTAAFRYPAGALRVGYNNETSGLVSETVQDAIDELYEEPINPEAHRILDQLTHILDEDYYEEYTYTGPNITNVIVWTDSGKTLKIREYTYTYTGPRVTGEVEKQYNGSGTLVETITYTYSYTGARINNITSVRTTP